MAINEVNGVRI